MKTHKYLILLFLIAFLAPATSSTYAKDKKEEIHLADGPYLFHLPDGGVRMVSTDVGGTLRDTTMQSLSPDYSFSVVSHDGVHRFEVKLHEVIRPAWKHKKPKKLLVLSDPHGNLECFISVLRGNSVINERYEWTYGKNHLVIVGDVFDRGKDVLPIFWLIYKLEKEAQEAGGQLSFLLGNHETMVLGGDLRYAEKMYLELAEKLGMEHQEMFSESTELGRWLASRNTMQIIGKELFVHAGLGEEFLNRNLSIAQVNEEISRSIFMSKAERNEFSPMTSFLYGNQGPIWFRGLTRNDAKYFPSHIDTVKQILKKYNVDRIIVGHTIFPDVISFYNGLVVAVNVNNKKNFDSVSGRGILVEKGKTFIVGDKNILRVLP